MGNDEEIIKEKFLENYPLPVTIEKSTLIIEQMKTSICIIDNKNGQGTGFFCSIPYVNEKLQVLITNNHVIDKTILENGEEVILKLNDGKVQKTLFLNSNRKMYTNEKYDTTIIELFPKNDGLEGICNFLELDELVLKRRPKENKKSVYIPQFPIFSEERKASVSYGIINEIKSDNYDIVHLCNTFPGSSGSPILMLSSNKVIGIHKGGSERFDFNKGTFLKFPIDEYLENKNIIKIKKNKEITKKEIYDIKYNEFIQDFKNKKYSNILFMIGGGVNGSKESIIFKNKEDYYKELENKKIFHLDHFLEKPKDFYKFVKSLNLNELKPNIYYKFMNFFVHKNLVKYIFTQNVDCLEIKAKIPSEKIVYVHGNYLSGHCPNCKKAASIDKIIEGIENEKVYYCPTCNSPCKPKIVLFGESLPEEFFTKIEECKDIDLIIAIGTYLTVTPFSEIPELTNKNAYKLLFNDAEVGNYQYENLEEKSLLILGENKKNIKNFLNDINLLNEYIDFLEKEYGEEF